MRLTSEQIDNIKKICKKNLLNSTFEIYLYGSRVNDEFKGGDIDLFLLSENWHEEDQKKMTKILVQMKLDKQIGDRKINLAFVVPEDLTSDHFWSHIKDYEKI